MNTYICDTFDTDWLMHRLGLVNSYNRRYNNKIVHLNSNQNNNNNNNSLTSSYSINENESPLFQVINHHVHRRPSSIMLFTLMDGAEIKQDDLKLKIMNDNTDDYEKDLQLAAELGRCLLERNQELQNCIKNLQQQIEDKDCEIKLLDKQLESTREQLQTKCQYAEHLDQQNFEFEKQLMIQRRESEQDRQKIKQLTQLCEKTRKQCMDIEQDYECFRRQQLSNNFNKQYKSSLSPSSPNSSKSNGIKRCSSIDTFLDNNNSSIKIINDDSLTSDLSFSSNDSSPTRCRWCLTLDSTIKNRLSEFKNKLTLLTNENNELNEKVFLYEHDNRTLLERLKITDITRQLKDENDQLQQELVRCKKLLRTKHDINSLSLDESNDGESSIDECSPSNIKNNNNVSLYDEVTSQFNTIIRKYDDLILEKSNKRNDIGIQVSLVENKQNSNKKTYETTNYRNLFQHVYDKLKANQEQATLTI
ncbi:unnamed protein product [Didymodactylos carnosus]|uniref:Cerebellar degeneration-related protein 2-like n=2 Tax=Didymodactylos carnosus TaxID=1234261 RepID=A0A814RGN9_9BILA|nr:unnamed protein product [Didymodactylos carnosus]CAF3897020.1 unnamed protein product [Didymodactylos carnosus]